LVWWVLGLVWGGMMIPTTTTTTTTAMTGMSVKEGWGESRWGCELFPSRPDETIRTMGRGKCLLWYVWMVWRIR
jgi:hypothetical protein